MSIFGFSASDIVTILQLGLSGVAFLFLAMSFILLRKEQDKDGEPRDSILKSIKQFSILSFAFAVLIAAISIFDKSTAADTGMSTECKAAIERAGILSASKEDHTAETLYELLRNTLMECD